MPLMLSKVDVVQIRPSEIPQESKFMLTTSEVAGNPFQRGLALLL